MIPTTSRVRIATAEPSVAERLRGVVLATGAAARLAPLANARSPGDVPWLPAARGDRSRLQRRHPAASTISSVTTELSTYFEAHPDANQALIDATRQPAFIAVGQFEDYTDAHPDQADAIRAINAPLDRIQGPLWRCRSRPPTP